MLSLSICSKADVCKVNQACLNALSVESEPFIFARSLNILTRHLRESLPLFKQLQRNHRSAPKFNGFEKNIGWDWEALLRAYNALRDLRHNIGFAIREYAIDDLNGFWKFARQIELNFECVYVDPELGIMDSIEREYVDEDVNMDEDDSVTDSQSVWGSSAQGHQGFMPPAHSNFATTSAGDTAKPTPSPNQFEPVRPTSDDLADINISSDYQSSMDLDARSQPPPPLPLPSGLPSSSAQAAEPSQPGNDVSQFDSRLSSIFPDAGLGQQTQAAARRAPAHDTPLTPIEEEEEEYEPPEFEEESEEEYEPPENFDEVGRPSVAEGLEQSASANDVEARNVSGYQNDDIEYPTRF